MSVEFTLLQLPEKPQYHPVKLAQVASHIRADSRGLPTVKHVLDSINNQELDHLQLIDWFCCIRNKAQWDQENSSLAIPTSISIWQATQKVPWLRRHLFWHLAFLSLGDQAYQPLANSLVVAFDGFVDSCLKQTDLSRQERIVLQVLQALKQPRLNLAPIAYQFELTHQGLVATVMEDLPLWILPAKKFSQDAAHYFSLQANQSAAIPSSKVEWLIQCFEENEDNFPEQGQAVSTLLQGLSKEIGTQFIKLVKWLTNHYRIGGRSQYLSEMARQKLQEWIGAVNYNEFAQLVEQIINRLTLEDYQINQIRRRKGFWANYSNHFENLRILVPSKSSHILTAKYKSDIDILYPDGSEDTEICIFDFGTHAVVEFFRGRCSETRLFDLKSNPDVRSYLFKSSNLSIQSIRNLGGEIHDHVFLWQGSCERWLRSRGILPNPGIQYFEGLSREHGKYNPQTGLPTPSFKDRQERERKLERWRREC